jgi:hypothetical protein
MPAVGPPRFILGFNDQLQVFLRQTHGVAAGLVANADQLDGSVPRPARARGGEKKKTRKKEKPRGLALELRSLTYHPGPSHENYTVTPSRLRLNTSLIPLSIFLNFYQNLSTVKIFPLVGKLFQFTKICKGPRLTLMFSGIKIYVSSLMPIRPYPSLALIKSITYLLFISYYISNIYCSSNKQTITQSRSYSCDKLTMRHAEWDVLDLITKFLQSSNEN